MNKSAPGTFCKAPGNDKSKVKCTVCQAVLVISSGMKDIERHISTNKHKDSVKAAAGQRSLFSFGMKASSMTAEERDHQSQVLTSEIMLCQYIAKSNSSFNSSTELLQ